MASSARSVVVQSPSSRTKAKSYSLEIGQRLPREADLERHTETFFAMANRASSFFSTAPDEKYTPVLFA